MLTVTWCCSECCVSSGIAFEATGGSVVLYCFSFAAMASSCYEQEKGALSWLYVETLKRSPNPLFGRLVWCSAHGCSFVRLGYVHLRRSWAEVKLHVIYPILSSYCDQSAVLRNFGCGWGCGWAAYKCQIFMHLYALCLWAPPLMVWCYCTLSEVMWPKLVICSSTG